MTSSLSSEVRDSAAGSNRAGEEASHATGESFWSVAYRRMRYTVGIIAAAMLFSTLGWKVAAPQPEWGGVSLITWQNHGLWAAFGLTVMLLAAIAVCSILVHPDSPHMGMFCALLGLAGLSIRGGNIHMLVEYAQIKGKVMEVSNGLALECLLWGIIVLVGEVFGRLLHDRFFANTHWITRGAPELAVPVNEGTAGFSMRASALNGVIGVPLAMIISAGLGLVMLYVLMQSQAKGQVLMACFVAFFISTMLAYMAIPRIPMLPFLLAVLLAGAAAYLGGRLAFFKPDALHDYPGHAGFFGARALPIDYVCAGVPGAILGYYSAFRWALHAHEGE